MRHIYTSNLKWFIFSFFFFTSFSFLSAQTVYWSDNFDAPAGGVNNNNGGLGWSTGANTPGGGQNTDFLGTSNNWTISTAATCNTNNKLYIRAFGLFGSNANSYLSDVFTDKYIFTPAISNIGASNITLSFTWRCNGVANQDYGLVGFSGDGGVTWNWETTRYQSQQNCTVANVAVPAQFENVANFRVAFRFISNATSCSTCEPPFNVDDITLSGNISGCESPIADAGLDASICAGGSTTIGGSPSASGGTGGPYAYAWSPATGLNNPSAANPVASPLINTTYTLTVTDISTSCTATSSVTIGVNAPQVLSTTPSNTASFCAGGSVSLSAANGFNNYVWNTPAGIQNGQTISANQAGNYSVSATGTGGCIFNSSTIIVSQQSTVSLTITSSGPLTLCPGESLTLSAEAGFSDYSWSNGSTGQNLVVTTPGTYSATATSGSGCPAVSQDFVITLQQAGILDVTASGPLTICAGQSLTLTAASGFSDYSWSNGETGISITVNQSGNYSATASNGSGCNLASAPVNVTVDAPFQISVTPSSPISLCEGQSITLVAQSGFSNYTWSNTQTGSTLNVTLEGVYSVSAQNSAGCSGTSSLINVSLTPLPNPSFTYVQLNEYEVQFTNTSTNGSSYLWTFPFANGTTTTSTLENPIFDFDDDSRIWQVVLTATNSCGTSTDTFDVVVVKTNLNEISGLNNLMIYPNPGHEFLQVSAELITPKPILLQVFDAQGKLIHSTQLNQNGQLNHLIDMQAEPSGLYYIRLNSDNQTMARKWIKF
jgi:hypothetical protein